MKGQGRSGAALIALGLVVVFAVQLTAPLGSPPLYDGVVVVEPYLWLDPPPNHPGGAQGTSDTLEVEAGASPLLAVATPEAAPQAQVFGSPGSLVLPPGATSINVSILPVAPPSVPSHGYIDGNVYRFEVTDQAGQPIAADPAALVSIVMRAADETLANAKIERFDGANWQVLDTSPAGLTGFLVVVTTFGDFAVVASGESPYPTPNATSTLAPTGAATVVPTEPPPPSETPTPSGQTSPAGLETPIVAGIAVLIALALGIGGLVLWRRRRPSDDVRGGWGR
jgi:hypothetical protein